MSLSPLSSESNHSSSALADYGINKDNTVVIKVNHNEYVCYSGYEEIEVQTLTEEDYMVTRAVVSQHDVPADAASRDDETSLSSSTP